MLQEISHERTDSEDHQLDKNREEKADDEFLKSGGRQQNQFPDAIFPHVVGIEEIGPSGGRKREKPGKNAYTRHLNPILAMTEKIIEVDDLEDNALHYHNHTEGFDVVGTVGGH